MLNVKQALLRRVGGVTPACVAVAKQPEHDHVMNHQQTIAASADLGQNEPKLLGARPVHRLQERGQVFEQCADLICDVTHKL